MGTGVEKPSVVSNSKPPFHEELSPTAVVEKGEGEMDGCWQGQSEEPDIVNSKGDAPASETSLRDLQRNTILAIGRLKKIKKLKDKLDAQKTPNLKRPLLPPLLLRPHLVKK